MPRITGYMNVYKAGYWHKAGKPGAFDRHAGDLYASYEEAFNAIEKPELYVDTVKVSWDDEMIHANHSFRLEGGVPVAYTPVAEVAR